MSTHLWSINLSQMRQEYTYSLLLFKCKVASLVTQLVKNLPAMQETQVQSMGQKDPLEKEMATYYRILAWRIPWTEEPGRLQFTGSQRMSWMQLSTHAKKKKKKAYSNLLQQLQETDISMQRCGRKFS